MGACFENAKHAARAFRSRVHMPHMLCPPAPPPPGQGLAGLPGRSLAHRVLRHIRWQCLFVGCCWSVELAIAISPALSSTSLYANPAQQKTTGSDGEQGDEAQRRGLAAAPPALDRPVGGRRSAVPAKICLSMLSRRSALLPACGPHICRRRRRCRCRLQGRGRGLCRRRRICCLC